MLCACESYRTGCDKMANCGHNIWRGWLVVIVVCSKERWLHSFIHSPQLSACLPALLGRMTSSSSSSSAVCDVHARTHARTRRCKRKPFVETVSGRDRRSSSGGCLPSLQGEIPWLFISYFHFHTNSDNGFASLTYEEKHVGGSRNLK